MFRLLSLLIGYAFGCIQSAYIAGRLIHNIDIREHGSKNSGFTNANRVMGFKTGVWIFLADVAKAVVAFIIASWLFEGSGSFLDPYAANGLLPGIWAGMGVVLGHCFPAMLKFRGGKGIASTVGLVFMLDWRAAVIIYVIAVVLILITRYISLASLVITLLTPVFMAVFAYGWEAVVVTAALAALAWFMHRGNIMRLANRTERRFSFKKKE
ncbi:MAG: glycerol-3-phosphate 1-O-acyltransferase PlsY [Defluviitaleaceae bacterium]|nr:glycerol-3-phosphate 1-O-acyltransferase PlsY [Defluviitaleaceae bacterium]